jgi:hypothetical protein
MDARNVALYDDTGFVSHHDAKQALEAPATTWRSFEPTSLREDHDVDIAHEQPPV